MTPHRKSSRENQSPMNIKRNLAWLHYAKFRIIARRGGALKKKLTLSDMFHDSLLDFNFSFKINQTS